MAAFPLVVRRADAGGLTQASGELATGSQQTTFDAMNLFMGLMTDPFIAGRGDRRVRRRAGYARRGRRQRLRAQDKRAAATRRLCDVHQGAAGCRPFEQRWSVWAAGFGGSQTTDGNAALGSNNTTSSIAGTAVGADYRFSPNTIAGFALAGGGTSFCVANGRQRPLRPVPGRRLRAPHRRAGLYLRRRWPMAGRTSPPTAP